MTELFPFPDPAKSNRLAMAIEFNGTAYRGWQRQRTDVPTIQAFLERAISQVANETVSTIVAGRTDAGVHATNQIVHFDTSQYRSNYGWMMGINGQLPNDICVKWVMPVNEFFHARFSAKERAYRYVIQNTNVKSALLHEMTTWEKYPLDVQRMQEAANQLLGTHDFSSFRAAECQAHQPIRTLRELTVERFGDLIVIQTRADGFLHHMVRNIVGVLLPIGRGNKPVQWAKDVLEFKDRNKGGVTAKGNGLYFVRAKYDNIELPTSHAGPNFIQPLIEAIPNRFSRI